MSEATATDLLRELQARGAILDGHFRLSSGRHSNRFVQKFRILEDPPLVERVASALAARARQLGTLGIFVEKENGTPALGRGSFAPESCPQCAAGEPLSEPGSRFLGAN
ncbi:MAG: orotate phosphoribosyltransferase [Candidatus Eremiobacteraeota bacterium]|jgi:hypothetical protein|nr:orotate phosphoribosyltransferase [Candidatus Eremiobacteraeota bacterium]